MYFAQCNIGSFFRSWNYRQLKFHLSSYWLWSFIKDVRFNIFKLYDKFSYLILYEIIDLCRTVVKLQVFLHLRDCFVFEDKCNTTMSVLRFSSMWILCTIGIFYIYHYVSMPVSIMFVSVFTNMSKIYNLKYIMKK